MKKVKVWEFWLCVSFGGGMLGLMVGLALG